MFLRCWKLIGVEVGMGREAGSTAGRQFLIIFCGFSYRRSSAFICGSVLASNLRVLCVFVVNLVFVLTGAQEAGPCPQLVLWQRSPASSLNNLRCDLAEPDLFDAVDQIIFGGRRPERPGGITVVTFTNCFSEVGESFGENRGDVLGQFFFVD